MRRRAFIPVIAGRAIPYLLRDEFNDTVAAGEVNNTTATPSGQVRTAVDTNSKISVGSGVLNFATGAVLNDNVTYPSIARVAGRALIADITTGNANGNGFIGWDTTSGGAVSIILAFSSSASIFLTGVGGAGIGSYATTTNYALCLLQRVTGVMALIKGGAYTNWTLLYPSLNGTSTPQFPVIGPISTTAPFTSSFVRVPVNLHVLTPLASDAFTRDNGVLGNTGGGGSEETGGSGLAWAAQLGTWGIATNKAASSALDGTANISIATVPCGSANIMAEVVATRSAGTSGLCLRYTDSSNYIKVVHNGTNLQVVEVVTGTPNTLVNAAATYGATARMIVSLKGDKVRAYYNNALIGTEATTAVTTGNNHGLFTDDTGATFDNFVVWAKGNGGEYDSLFNQYANP